MAAMPFLCNGHFYKSKVICLKEHVTTYAFILTNHPIALNTLEQITRSTTNHSNWSWENILGKDHQVGSGKKQIK